MPDWRKNCYFAYGMRVRCVVVLGLLAPLLGFSQGRVVPYWGFGAFGGASWYSGELTTGTAESFPGQQVSAFRFTQFAVGGHISYQWHPHMGLRLTGTFAKVEGDDAQSPDAVAKARGLNATTDVVEFSLQWTYDFVGAYKGLYSRAPLTPYVFAGLGGFYFRPVGKVNLPGLQGSFDLREFRTEGQAEAYPEWALVVPFGMGLRAAIARRWDLRVELGLRKTFTDYLDDVSGATPGRGGRFADPADLGSTLPGVLSVRTAVAYQSTDPFAIPAKANTRRGNPETDDWYAFGGVSLSYLVPSKPRCPEPPKPRRSNRFLFF